MPNLTRQVWTNRKLRSSKEKRADEEEDKDNFQVLLQQYKDVRGQLAALKQQEDLLSEMSSVGRKANTGQEIVTDQGRDGASKEPATEQKKDKKVTESTALMPDEIKNGDHWTVLLGINGLEFIEY